MDYLKVAKECGAGVMREDSEENPEVSFSLSELQTYSEAIIKDLRERLAESHAIIARLGSTEAFTLSRAIDEKMDAELIARIEFARTALKQTT